MEEKHCKWYNDEFCTNGDSPCVADYCPVVEYPDLCKHRERDKDINVRSKTEEKRKKILANRIYSDATLKRWKKEDLIEQIRILEHNWTSAEESLNIQAKNCEMLLKQAEKDTAKEIYNEIGDNDILVITTQEYGSIEVVPLERLQEYRSKIEQGTLIELPCKVGDTVYRVTQSYRSAGQVTPYIVKEIIINKKGVSYLTIALKGTQSITCKVKSETVFLTREEAEKRLKELQNG